MILIPLLNIRTLLLMALFIGSGFSSATQADDALAILERQEAENEKLVYLVSDTRIPFWSIMAKGIASTAQTLGYEFEVYSANNDTKKELEHTIKAMRESVAGIIMSPTTSSASVTILKLAKKANIPVVISDIGTDSGEYVSYVSSDNKQGAYDLGKVLVKRMRQQAWDKGRVGIIAIPQKRANGRDRTAGFMQALNEANIKAVGISQQVTFSYQETYDFSKELINNNPDLRAIWLQGSDRYQAALDAISDAGKQADILLISFDAEPIFLELIPQNVLVGAAMQQPFLMGQEAVIAMHKHLNGKDVVKNLQLPILTISSDNIVEQLPNIYRNVLGMDSINSGHNDKN